MIETIVNTPVKIPFVSEGNATGLTIFSGSWILKNGAIVVLTTTFEEIGNGLYVATFTPTSTGIYTYYVAGQIQATINVVSKTTAVFLQNLEDVALGSWSWDKNLGTLVFTRQDGTALATFSVEDTLIIATRERQ